MKIITNTNKKNLVFDVVFIVPFTATQYRDCLDGCLTLHHEISLGLCGFISPVIAGTLCRIASTFIKVNINANTIENQYFIINNTTGLAKYRFTWKG